MGVESYVRGNYHALSYGLRRKAVRCGAAESGGGGGRGAEAVFADLTRERGMVASTTRVIVHRSTVGGYIHARENQMLTSRMTLTPLNPKDRLDTPPEILQYGQI